MGTIETTRTVCTIEIIGTMETIGAIDSGDTK